MSDNKLAIFGFGFCVAFLIFISYGASKWEDKPSHISDKSKLDTYISNDLSVISDRITQMAKKGYKIISICPQSIARQYDPNRIGAVETFKGDILLVMSKE